MEFSKQALTAEQQAICILYRRRMGEEANPSSDFRNKLKDLFAEYQNVNIIYMGF
jgi:hypothetical protein